MIYIWTLHTAYFMYRFCTTLRPRRWRLLNEYPSEICGSEVENVWTCQKQKISNHIRYACIIYYYPIHNHKVHVDVENSHTHTHINLTFQNYKELFTNGHADAYIERDTSSETSAMWINIVRGMWSFISMGRCTGTAGRNCRNDGSTYVWLPRLVSWGARHENRGLVSCKVSFWLHPKKTWTAEIGLTWIYVFPRLITYNASISACGKASRWEVVMLLLTEIELQDVMPESYLQMRPPSGAEVAFFYHWL